MSSRPPGSIERRSTRHSEPEDSYPHIKEPNQGHTAHLFAFLSVLAVLGFGIWAALGTLLGSADQPAAKTAATATITRTATAASVATATTAPVATAQPSAAAAQPSPGATSTSQSGGGKVHVVGEGDTLYRIAQRYGTTVEAIMAANGFTDRSKVLHVGDRLTIP